MDENDLKLVDILLSANSDSNRITAIETAMPFIQEDIKLLKQKKDDAPKEVELKKDKLFLKIIQVISAICGISGLIIGLINLLN